MRERALMGRQTTSTGSPARWLVQTQSLPFCSISNNFPYFFLGVESPIGCFLSGRRWCNLPPWHIFPVNAPRTYFCEFRVFFDLNTPAVIIGQVPVKNVHLVHGQQVDVSFDELFREKMAGDIQMHAAVGEPGMIPDIDGGDLPFFFFRWLGYPAYCRWEQLQ